MYVGGLQEGWTRDAKWKERGFTLATKVYPYKAGVHEPESLKEHFNTSLKELGTDTVDIFYLHAPDRSVPFEKTLEAVNELHKEGNSYSSVSATTPLGRLRRFGTSRRKEDG